MDVTDQVNQIRLGVGGKAAKKRGPKQGFRFTSNEVAKIKIRAEQGDAEAQVSELPRKLVVARSCPEPVMLLLLAVPDGLRPPARTGCAAV